MNDLVELEISVTELHKMTTQLSKFKWEGHIVYARESELNIDKLVYQADHNHHKTRIVFHHVHY